MDRGFTFGLNGHSWDYPTDIQFARLRKFANWVRTGFMDYSNAINDSTTYLARAALAGGIDYPNYFPPFNVVMTGLASTGSLLNRTSFQSFRTKTLAYAQYLLNFMVANNIPLDRLIFSSGGNEEDRDVLYAPTSIVYNGDGTATATFSNAPGFLVGELLYVTGCNQAQYNTPAYVSDLNRGGGLITAVSPNGKQITYMTNGTPSTSPATGGFIRCADIGRLELQYLLTALDQDVKAIPGWGSPTCVCFNDTYLPDYTSDPVKSAVTYTYIFLNEYKNRASFVSNVTLLANTWGLRGGLSEWDAGDNGFTDFNDETKYGQECAWRDAFIANLLNTGKLKYDFNYSFQEGQDIWTKVRKNSIIRDALYYMTEVLQICASVTRDV